MKVSYKTLLSYLDEKPSIEDLSEKLFQLGHEHEVCEDIIDIDLTPNRGDCLSINGLLRELKLFYVQNNPSNTYKNKIKNFDFKFENKAKEACPKISFLKIDIESIPNNYNYIVERYFTDLDINKNNFFTDISNYISYETGQPTHCYDADKVKSGLSLHFLKKNEKFHTLLDKTIDLNKSNLVFSNSNNEAVNLAGLVGSKNSSCNQSTKSVILECAYFVPEFIIGKTVEHSLCSDAAYKFERGVDPDCHDFVIRRFIKVVEEHTKIKNLEIFTQDYSSPNQKPINLDIKKINNILGTKITLNDCINYLQNFGFIIEDLRIHVPSYRHDIININDIAEEIARAIGYSNINPAKFQIPFDKSKNLADKNEKTLKNLLVKNGFYEVINDPFTNEHNKNSIKIDNPLDSKRRYIRTNLKQSLIGNLAYNERRQKDSIKLFEVSEIYNLTTESSKKHIGIIVSGRVDNNYIDFSKKLNLKFLKDLLCNYVDVKDLPFEVIERDGVESKSKNTIAYVEFELNQSMNINFSSETEKVKNIDFNYTPVSDYPSSYRDLSFSIKDYSKSEQLQDYIFKFNNELLKDVFIFDYFFNETKAEIKIGFRFIFQSDKATITEKEVSNIMNEIIRNTSSINGIKIPGIENL